MLLCRSRVDCGRIVQVWLGAEIAEDLAGDVVFEAANDFRFGLALHGASANVVQCRLVAAHADDHHPVEGGIGLFRRSAANWRAPCAPASAKPHRQLHEPRRPANPGVVARLGHVEHARHGGDREAGLILAHNRKSPAAPRRSPVQTRPRLLTGYRAPTGAACSHAADAPTRRIGDEASNRFPLSALLLGCHSHPSANRLRGRLKLAGKVLRRSPRTDPIDHLAAKLRRIRRATYGHQEHL